MSAVCGCKGASAPCLSSVLFAAVIADCCSYHPFFLSIELQEVDCGQNEHCESVRGGGGGRFGARKGVLSETDVVGFSSLGGFSF